ncbi:MFS transporter [Streptomyces uncialis]|uniref:MFS transporter n=1 Tax=Streptomyces uncialis TaxID=1048205 RepID=UPI002E33B595|nr:MFS transporter [Streptomyces uncialis]
MSYREVVSKAVGAWAVVAVGARLPVAMAPLALVFFVRERPGGYTLGAALAAVYVVGEIVGAPLLGMRMRSERARPHLAAGLCVGAAAFVGLGLLPGGHPLVLGVLAFVAGAAPAAAPGGLRALLTTLVPDRAVTQVLSVESMLTNAVWAASPALVAGLALGVAPATPLLLAGGFMGASVVGLWLLPPGWTSDPDDRGGEPMARLMARVWPVYVLGAAGLAPLALAELVLPALLEHRGVGVGWTGPLLAGLSVGAAAGAYVYGLRSWPGRLPTQGLVLLCGLLTCVIVVALVPNTVVLAVALACGGVLQAGALLARNLSLREVLPPSAVAAGYSLMYAAVGAGYAAAGSLAGVLLGVTTPSGAMLAGVGLTAVLIVVAAVGERRLTARVRCGAGSSPLAGSGGGASSARGEGGARPEGAPVRGGRDTEGGL